MFNKNFYLLHSCPSTLKCSWLVAKSIYTAIKSTHIDSSIDIYDRQCSVIKKVHSFSVKLWPVSGLRDVLPGPWYSLDLRPCEGHALRCGISTTSLAWSLCPVGMVTKLLSALWLTSQIQVCHTWTKTELIRVHKPTCIDNPTDNWDIAINTE